MKTGRKRVNISTPNSMHIDTNSPRKIFLGLDLSLGRTGMVFWNGHKAVLLSIVPPPSAKACIEERISEILNKIVLALGEYPPTFTAVEGPAYSRPQGAFKTGMLAGAVRTMLWQSNILFAEVDPISLKKFATGNHKAPKQEMIKAAKDRGIPVSNDDEADAFFLAKWACDKYATAVELAP